MGWSFDDLPGHEGYIVGLVQDETSSWRKRELRMGDEAQPVEHIAVACDCGWRSQIVRAPYGTRFLPSTVVFRELDEERVEDLALAHWREHVERERRRRFGKYFSQQSTSWLHEDPEHVRSAR